MGVRTLQIAAYRTVGITAETIYTVPADHTLIVKEIVISWRTSVVPGTLRVLLDPVGATATTGILLANFATQLEAQRFERWTVCEPGDVLQTVASSVQAAFVVVSGTLLEGVA